MCEYTCDVHRIHSNIIYFLDSAGISTLVLAVNVSTLKNLQLNNQQQVIGEQEMEKIYKNLSNALGN